MVTNRLDIVFEDKDVLVVSKPTNLLSVSTLKEKERTLFHLCSSYVKKRHTRYIRRHVKTDLQYVRRLCRICLKKP